MEFVGTGCLLGISTCVKEEREGRIRWRQKLKCDPEPLKLLAKSSGVLGLIWSQGLVSCWDKSTRSLIPPPEAPLDVILLGKDVLLFRVSSLQLRLNLKHLKPVG